ncbi:MAG: SLC26A/SulP transporter family protein [Caldilineales bacterium]|nr:SLC26A/SulP transporter family protein [Caldilineales bacterium]
MTDNASPPTHSTFLNGADGVLDRDRLIPGLAGGLIIGLLQVVLAVSFSALIYTGPLADALPVGIGLTLAGALALVIVITALSSWPGMVACNQDVPATILAVIVAGVAAAMPATAGQPDMLATVLIAVALASVLTGLVAWLLGRFKLGSLVRFVPYPVLGGFLAGTGWLLVVGAVSFMTDTSATLANLPTLATAGEAVQWLPGVALGFIMLFLLKRYSHPLLFPATLVVASILFFVFLFLSGTSVAEAAAQGLFIGPFPESALWSPLRPAMLADVYWPAIWGQAATIAVMIVVSILALLLNVSALELATRQEVQANRELRAAGIGNLLTGLLGGMVGYQALSLSVLNSQLKANHRWTGIVSAGILAITLIFGATVLWLAPRMIVGAVLFFLGVSFLYDWVYRSWFKLSRADYAIVLLILVVIATVGYLEGVVVGLVTTIIVFVINYSWIDVVQRRLSGASYHSRVVRRPEHQFFCQNHGDRIFILQLQGYLFFGTGHGLLEDLRLRLYDSQTSPLQYFVLDFRQVIGVDSTATLSLGRVMQLADQNGVEVVIAGLRPELELRLRTAGLFDVDSAHVHLFPDLDRALEWCEAELLAASSEEATDHGMDIVTQLRRFIDRPAQMQILLSYLHREEYGPGAYLIQQNDEPDDMFLIESGEVTVLLRSSDGKPPIRLQTIHGGNVVGEMGFYLDIRRTAAVVVDAPTIAYRLRKQDLQRMQQEQPDVAATLHELMVHMLALRVRQMNATVSALES